MAFGVELPEKYGGSAPNPPEPKATPEPKAPNEGGAPSESFSRDNGSDQAPDTDTSLSEAAAPEITKEVLDLDKLERFRFGGKELTPKELRNATLMREDYSRKTQEVAEARKYADNFPADLEKVVRNPKLLTELKRIYPANYVKVAERLIKANASTTASTPDGKPKNIDPEIMSRIDAIQDRLDNEVMSRLDNWDNQQREAGVQRLQVDLDRQFDTLSKKYSDAIPEVINSRAIVVAEQGHAITPQVLEALFKQNDDEMKSRVSTVQRNRVEEQRKVNAQGRGMGAGGGTPGHAPKVPKNMKDAKKQLFADIEAGTFSRK